MTPHPHRTCGKCRAFAPHSLKSEYGQCRRKSKGVAGWPEVSKYEWCCDFLPGDPTRHQPPPEEGKP